jgi:uncharacterized membrane protein YheB (UPF0754 family)
MSRKKAKSNLPSELNENWGSNYMMDGFWQDMEYGNGLKENPAADPVPQPNTSGMSHLPGSVISEEEEGNVLPSLDIVELEGGFDLGELGIVASDSDRTDAGIVDLSWLADAHQDPDRLPSNSVDNVIPELQEAWGNRTDGIQRIDLVDRDAVQFQDAFQAPEDDDTLNPEKLAHLIRSAMRQSAAGDITFAQKWARMPKLARSMKAVEAEHGLHGTVYLRASAYPRLHQGRYAKQFKKAAKGCRYLVGEDNSYNQDVANLLHLTLVPITANIDWRETYKSYGPKLAATGRLKAAGKVSTKNIPEILRRAFLGQETSPRMDIESSRRRVSMPADGVTAQQAKKALAEFKPSHREVLSLVQREKRATAEKVIKKLGAWVQASLISKEDVDRIIKTQAAPMQILRTAADLINSAKKGEYNGAGRDRAVHVLKRQAAFTRDQWNTEMTTRAQGYLSRDRDRLVKRVSTMVTAGVITQAQANKLLDDRTDSRLAMQAASKMASTTKTARYDQGTARHQGSADSRNDASPEAIRRHATDAQQEQNVATETARQATVQMQHRQAAKEQLLLKVGKIEQLVEDGASKAKLQKAVRANFSLAELRVVHARLEPILIRGKFYEKEASAEYQGAVMTRAQQVTPDMTVSPSELQRAARWVRQQMSEGLAGEELDQLIQLRLTPKVAKAGAKRIKKARQTHEGLAGHLYVDAGAYGTKSGTKGCDKGALRHRANQLKFVLAQKQCDGCVYKNADGVCQKYNKTIVDEVPEGTESFREQMIASHAATDQEHTADLFSLHNLEPALNDVTEFGLHNGALDDVGSEAPEVNQLSEIFFGGFNI